MAHIWSHGFDGRAQELGERWSWAKGWAPSLIA